ESEDRSQLLSMAGGQIWFSEQLALQVVGCRWQVVGNSLQLFLPPTTYSLLPGCAVSLLPTTYYLLHTCAAPSRWLRKTRAPDAAGRLPRWWCASRRSSPRAAIW